MSTRYFVDRDGGGDLALWREEEGAEHRPEPVIYAFQVNDEHVWTKLVEAVTA